MYGPRGISMMPAERRTNAKIIKKFRTAEVYQNFRRSVYARHFAKLAFDEMEDSIGSK